MAAPLSRIPGCMTLDAGPTIRSSHGKLSGHFENDSFLRAPDSESQRDQ